MNKITALYLLMILSNNLPAQTKLPFYPDSLFSTYYHQRWTLFQSLPQTKGDIIFIGNSITDGGEWSELFNDVNIKNRGISGDITAGVIKRIEEVVKRKPAKVFLLIGTNDLARGISPDSVVKNILLTSAFIKQESPSTKLFVQSILPVNDAFGKFSGHTSKAQQIKLVNEELQRQASKFGYRFLDLYKNFSDEKGKLKQEFTNDGLHLTGEAYLFWKHLVYGDVYGLANNPLLLPAPQQLKWTGKFFPLYKCKSIEATTEFLQKEAAMLQELLSDKGLIVSQERSEGFPFIQMRLGKIASHVDNEEAYKLTVTSEHILLEANTAKGIFYAIETLKQLMRDNVYINTCEITDWPAFPWRGYMIDVGRNFQSISQLKQQIDVMAAYKLNTFHLHLTEDIAWRLQSKRYPQLTDATYMQRNPGEFYSLDEMRELIAYCKNKYIRLIPEIDMPGHSGAFTRALKVDMQSDSGLMICKDIIKELSNELDVDIIHIGGDEVKITNKIFLPEIAALLQSLNRKVMAWDPGGNLPKGTTLQMWTGGTTPKIDYPSVDSRHLYINHFDPLEGVVAIFNHLVCDAVKGDEHKLGGILCNWPDRRVSKEEDLINMNAIYPTMLSFSERCWLGGGWKNYLSDIGSPGNERYNAFVEFENRLLEHGAIYFRNRSFPYVKQSDLEWKLIGPFDNKGKTATVFHPEANSFTDTVQLEKYPSVFGGTILLRHFWSPMIGSHLNNSQDSTTYYAIRKIWSEEAGLKNFWIGFNNLGRANATDSPPVGEWDHKSSKIWVNGKLISPPNWKRGGEKGHAEIPLFDEGYEYREPSKIYLHKGWNTILIKAPVGTFKSEWNNPVKWMFTFVMTDY